MPVCVCVYICVCVHNKSNMQDEEHPRPKALEAHADRQVRAMLNYISAATQGAIFPRIRNNLLVRPHSLLLSGQVYAEPHSISTRFRIVSCRVVNSYVAPTYVLRVYGGHRPTCNICDVYISLSPSLIRRTLPLCCGRRWTTPAARWGTSRSCSMSLPERFGLTATLQRGATSSGVRL